MYYTSSYQNTPARLNNNTRLHTAKMSYRKFAARFLLMFAVMMIAITVGAIVQANAGTNEKQTNVRTEQAGSIAAVSPAIMVEQGDTLWNISQAHAPKGTDIRSYVEQIKRVNHLSGSTLRIGQKLLLP